MNTRALLAIVPSFLILCAEAATIAGPPTYSSVSTITEDRGTILGITHLANNSTGYAGSGGSTGSATVTFFLQGSNEPTEAKGIASQVNLKSLSRVTGELGFPDPTFPSVEARNRSQTTRYFRFSTTQAMVPLDILAFLDGSLTSFHATEVTQEVRSSVHFGLEIVDTMGSLIAPIFSANAQNMRQANTYAVSSTSSGALDPLDWDAAIGPLQPPFPLPSNLPFDPSGGIKVDISLFENLKNAYMAPANQVLGFRWFLETEARIKAAYDYPPGALVESDFFNTANLGIELNENAPNDVVVTEILSVAPVPVPPAVALFLPALFALLKFRRHARYSKE